MWDRVCDGSNFYSNNSGQNSNSIEFALNSNALHGVAPASVLPEQTSEGGQGRGIGCGR